jgi:hypothetical protein
MRGFFVVAPGRAGCIWKALFVISDVKKISTLLQPHRVPLLLCLFLKSDV